MSTSSEHLEWTAPEQFGTAVVTCTPCVLFWKHTHSLVIPPFVLAWLLDWWTQWRRWLITKWVRHLVKLVQIPFHFNSCSRAESLFCHRAKQSLVLFFTTRVKLGFFFLHNAWSLEQVYERQSLSTSDVHVLILPCSAVGFPAAFVTLRRVRGLFTVGSCCCKLKAVNFEAGIKLQPLHLGLWDRGNVAGHWEWWNASQKLVCVRLATDHINVFSFFNYKCFAQICSPLGSRGMGVSCVPFCYGHFKTMQAILKNLRWQALWLLLLSVTHWAFFNFIADVNKVVA